MRDGYLFRRCGKCGRRVNDRRCSCGSDAFTWAYRVDVAPKGAPRQQRFKAGFRTKDEARAAMAALQTAKKDGTFVEPSKITTGAYLEQWVAGVKSAVRGSTWRSYEVAMRLHISPILGRVPLQQLTRNQVRAMYDQLGASGRSVKTVHNTHLALRKALADAVDDGLIRTNPAERAHKLPTDRPEMLTWSREELRVFLDRSTADPNLPLWRLLAMTGVRRGEALGVRWSDLDLDGARLSVRQQLVRQGDLVTFGPPKTKAGRRSIALDPGTVEALRDRRAQWRDEKLALGEGYQDLDLVFARADGRPHDPDVISQQFETATRRAGVKRIRLHDVRHTHATLGLAAGIHPKVMQERLGHSSIVVTMDRYSHVIPNMQDEAAAKLGMVVDGR